VVSGRARTARRAHAARGGVALLGRGACRGAAGHCEGGPLSRRDGRRPKRRAAAPPLPARAQDAAPAPGAPPGGADGPPGAGAAAAPPADPRDDAAAVAEAMLARAAAAPGGGAEGAAARLPRLGVALQFLGVDYGAAGAGSECLFGVLGLPLPFATRRARPCDAQPGAVSRAHAQPPLAAAAGGRTRAEFRRQGVGRALFDLLEGVAAEAG
jgi:hypothetical protein